MNKNQRADEAKTAKGLGSRIDHGQQPHLSKNILHMGDVSKKIPVPLSDGRTIVFAKSAEDVERVKAFWENKIKFIGL